MVPLRDPNAARGDGLEGPLRRATQKWFAFRFVGDDSEIDIEQPGGGKHKPEFGAWRWERLAHVPKLIVPFKREVYEQVVKEFSRFVEG